MDDKEYYSMKRITSLSVEQLQKNLSRTTQKKSQKDLSNSNFRETAIFQGHDDAEMLLEKQVGFEMNVEE